ncbi:hypothetical protein B0J11DRAFT_537302 [Dendryphion nanum]|uniref:Zn(2)-C6 fungal-type domain-containing protein n=1 Tax=Dendryphion nanum TaxID=256645 RepID=A0A9P9DCN2_9PLEO|nr:hypothetical protein B0J11DRAFT_537302 [Dendryphion nanum]
MKIKQDSVCHTCRAHKIGCDGKRPTCSQCLMTKRQCGGYQLDAVFVPYSTKLATRSSRKALPTRASAKLPSVVYSASCITDHSILEEGARDPQKCWIPGLISSVTSDEFTAVILNSFVPGDQLNQSSFDSTTSQVCGAWVEILPSLVAQAQPGGLISLATRAFGTAILDRSHEGKSKGFRSSEAYIATLHELKKALLTWKSSLSIETAAAIVCLAMAELLLPTSNEAMYAHCRGLSALLGSYMPELFSSDSFHSIFVGCRPVLLFQACDTRKSTFLAQEKWLTIPFRHHPPSDMQKLIGEAAIIPSIMEEIDLLPSLPHAMAISRAFKAQDTVSGVLKRLDDWKGRFGRLTIGPPTGYLQILDPDRAHITASNIWFPNLLAANVHIHLWAFQIICIAQLETLSLYTFGREGEHETGNPRSYDRNNFRQLSLAAKIRQSVEYLLQDAMKLHGPAAALFPLKIAYDVFMKDAEGNREHIRHCHKLFDRIYNKGFSKGGASSVNDGQNTNLT